MKSVTILALSATSLVACVDHKPPLGGTNSIAVNIVSPTSVGSVDDRLDDAARHVVFNLQALDQDGEPDPTFGNTVQMYVQFLGTLTPYLGGPPQHVVKMVNGVSVCDPNYQPASDCEPGQPSSDIAIDLPLVYGPTNLWFDDGEDDNATYATGASDAIFYRDPFIKDIQTPLQEKALNALTDSPLENKNIDVDQSRYADGLLVVTSVFAQGYTVQDMSCPGGHAPCTTMPYDGLLIFSFSAPTYSNGADDETTFDVLQEGQVMARFNGGVEEFNGLTEIGFPQNFPATPARIDKSLEPLPMKIQAGRAALGETQNWFGPLSDDNGEINFERYEASPVELDQGVVCALDDDYTTFKQWKIDPNGTPSAMGADCSHNHNVINIITSGVIADLDPATLVGKTLPRLVGIVRPVEIGSFNVWIIYPRGSSDLTLPQ